MIAALATLLLIGIATSVPVAMISYQLANADRVALNHGARFRRANRAPAPVIPSWNGPVAPMTAGPSVPPSPFLALLSNQTWQGTSSRGVCTDTLLSGSRRPVHDPARLLRFAGYLADRGCDWSVHRVIIPRNASPAFDPGSVEYGVARLADGAEVSGLRIRRAGADMIPGLARGDVLTAINGYRVGEDPPPGTIDPGPPGSFPVLVFEVIRAGHHVVLEVVPPRSESVAPDSFATMTSRPAVTTRPVARPAPMATPHTRRDQRAASSIRAGTLQMRNGG